ncbi:MAG: hypothetical protein C5B48_10625 [Candidatus Rokuibacteriota bacterium]|nr:MAG: hypothetical protein C5B48_10625 [Candidatus Rokubacteria bacterium]
MTHPEDSSPPRAQVESTLAAEILKVHEESYGTGASDIQTHYFDDNVLIIIDVELSRAEQTLREAGRGEAVKATREAFQAAIGPTFNAIVERATGRRVDMFFSWMHVDPPTAVELFRLRPH